MTGRSDGKPESHRGLPAGFTPQNPPHTRRFFPGEVTKVERCRRWAGAQATNRGVGVREPGCSGRLASRNGSVQGGQRELVSLLRVFFLLPGLEAACVRASPVGRDAGGTTSGWGVQVAISQQ